MGSPRGFLILVIASAALLVLPDIALAWGPATHVKIARDILSELQALSPALAALLARFARDFLFGNIAADVVFAKRLARIKQHCHQWSTAFEILDSAPTESGRAFACGYLAHLAADTVAHGKFLPRQVTLTGTTLSFGHIYWEMRADSAIGTHYWEQLRQILAHRYDQHETLLAQQLTQSVLPFRWNRAIFYRINRTVSRRGWIRTADAWYDRSRWELPDDILAEYRRESVDRAIDVLVSGRRSPVTHMDPNGTIALGHARIRRRQNRRMARAGILHPHVLAEAVARHAPRRGRPDYPLAG